MGVLGFAYTALALMYLSAFQVVEASSAAPDTVFEDSEGAEGIVLDSVWPLLESERKVARIYYRAVCPSEESYPLIFPRVDVTPPTMQPDALERIRSVFIGSQDLVTVTEPETGVIKIRIGSVSGSILRTRISKLDLDLISQYNAQFAIFAIEKAPEIRKAMSTLNLRIPARLNNILMSTPDATRPHLPAHLSDLTMDEALDLVAKTWGGIVVYGECGRPDMFDIYFPRSVNYYK